MALATRCPACNTIFRISTAQAAAKGGMVRCGQCRNVFNSLDALVRVEDLDIVDEAVVEDDAASFTATYAPSYAPLPETTAFERTDDDRSFGDAAEPGFPHSEVSDVLASLSAPTADHSTSHAWWMPDPAGRREPSTTPTPASAPASTPSAARSAAPTTTSLHDPSPSAMGSTAHVTADEPARPAFADPVAGEPDALPWDASDSGTGPVFMQPTRAAEPVDRAARWAWGILSFLALLLLLGQVAYMERDELAARWSPARPWLATACSMLGCTVDYPAHPDAITIESATIQTPAADANLYVLTALLRNRDTIDIRYPYLELVLTDVQDRIVLRRVLRPEDYAPRRAEGRALVSPGFAAQSELPVRLTFELAGLTFTGYRLDRFYP